MRRSEITDAVEHIHGSRWMHPDTKPPRAGLYERQSLLGVTVDVWDGAQWRRPSGSHSVKRDETVGVVCANQDLPWREIRS